MSVCIIDLARQHRHRRPARDAGLQRAAVAHAAGHLQQLRERACPGAPRSCPGARRWPDTEKILVPPLFGRPSSQEGLAAVDDDPGHRREGLGVVDRGGLAVQAVARRERRLEARQPLLAFQRFQQRGFLAADVGAVAVVGVQVEAELRAEDVLAEIARRVGLAAAPPRSARRRPRSRRECSCSPPRCPSRRRAMAMPSITMCGL